MNIYYLVRNDKENNNDTGFFNKFYGQIKVFRNHGNVIFIYFKNKEIYADFFPRKDKKILNDIKISGKSPLNHLRYFTRIFHLFDEIPPSVLYIRYKISEPTFLNFLRRVTNQYPECKIFVEFPTFPYDQNWKDESFIKKALLPVDKFFRRYLHKYIDYTVNYTGTKETYGIQSICIKNGIDLDIIKTKRQSRKNNQISLIGVAGLGYWHGYDRVIYGIHEYYRNKLNDTKINITFTIVGDGREKENLINLTKELSLTDKIIFTGTKISHELDKLFDNADIAVSAIGTHRMNVYIHSALKNREYCARCIPFINAGIDEDFSKKCKFILNIPLDDSPVDMNQVISFYKSVRRNKNLPAIMRKYAENNLSWEAQLKTVVEKFITR